MVAPSFQSFEIVSEVFDKNGRKYIKVKNPKTSTIREVRWYNEIEYAKAYSTKLAATAPNLPGDGIDAAWEFYHTEEGNPNIKNARGFKDGPILVIRGVRNQKDEDWLRHSVARYAMGVGWYITSSDSLPLDAPAHFKYVLLGWEEMRDGDDCHVKRPSEIANLISKKLHNNKEVIRYDNH